MRPLRELQTHTALAVIIAGFITLALTGCGQSQLTGIIQNSKWASSGWELSLGTSPNSDYIKVDRAVLLDLQGRIVAAKDPRNIMLLGNQYVGMRIRVSGNVERDTSNRRFIKVTQREQIEIR